MDYLRLLLKEGFNFKTDYFEMPFEGETIALHRRLVEFCFEYDSSEDLAIIYNGGHAYKEEETKKFKLARKYIVARFPLHDSATPLLTCPQLFQ